MESCELSKWKYRNWVKAVLALNILWHGICDFLIEKKIVRKKGDRYNCCLFNDMNKKHEPTKRKEKDHDLNCKIRMMRNDIVHSPMMKLSGKEFEVYIRSCLDLLKSPDLIEIPGVKEAIYNIEILHMQKDVTLLEELGACKLARKWVDETVRNIAEVVNDIYKCEPMKKAKTQIQSTHGCPLQGKENSQLKQLKHKADHLFRMAQSLDDNDPTLAEQIKEIRQLLRRIEIDLDSLENAQRNQQRKLSWILKVISLKEQGIKSLPLLNPWWFKMKLVIIEQNHRYPLTKIAVRGTLETLW